MYSQFVYYIKKEEKTQGPLHIPPIPSEQIGPVIRFCSSFQAPAKSWNAFLTILIRLTLKPSIHRKAFTWYIIWILHRLSNYQQVALLIWTGGSLRTVIIQVQVLPQRLHIFNLPSTIYLWIIFLTFKKNWSILLLKLYNDGTIGIRLS